MTSPAGNEFAISTGEGVSIFSKNKTSFASIPLNEAATPQNAISKVKNEEFGSALVIALTLNDENLIREIIENIPLKAIEVLTLSLPSNIVLPLLSFISRYLTCHTCSLFYFIIVSYNLKKSLITTRMSSAVMYLIILFVFRELESTKHSQIYLRWCSNLLKICAKDANLKRKVHENFYRSLFRSSFTFNLSVQYFNLIDMISNFNLIFLG